MKRKTTLLGTALLGMIPPCTLAAGATARDVDARAIGALEQAADQRLSNGRTYGEQRYSPLRQINAGNVAHIGEAWEADLESPRFGIEATPLVVTVIVRSRKGYSRSKSLGT